MSPISRRIIQERTASLRLVHYRNDEGRECYLYLLITLDREEEFIQRVEEGRLDFEDIGVIVYRGEDSVPEGMNEHILRHILKPEQDGATVTGPVGESEGADSGGLLDG